MMNMRHNEDRELDIKIAELQANVQICLAATFGFTTLFATVALVFWQTMHTVVTEQAKIVLGVLSVIAAFSSACFGVYFARKVIETRDRIKDLRKQYVW